MSKINELQLAKELIKFPSVTPIDAGVMKFLEITQVIVNLMFYNDSVCAVCM